MEHIQGETRFEKNKVFIRKSQNIRYKLRFCIQFELQDFLIVKDHFTNPMKRVSFLFWTVVK